MPQMTIAQLSAYAEQATSLTLKEVGRALDELDRTVILRPTTEPKEWR